MSDKIGTVPGGGRGLPLFRVAGIQIRIDYSWFLIFLLVLWSLSVGYFPHVRPGQSSGAYWAAGFVATFLFFASLIAHELAHSIVAVASGIRISAITLFLFGGVSQMEDEPRRPAAEIRIAAVGPLMSFAIAAGFWGLYVAFRSRFTGLGSDVLLYLAWINAALGVFNLIPGFPLDGGRVLRAIAWWKTGSLSRATKLASDAGKGFAIGLMILGGFEIFSGALIGGLWLIFIGMFLRGMANAGYQNLVIRRALDDVSVADVMVRDVVGVDAHLPVRKLIDEFFLGYGFRGFPVFEGGRVRGVVSIGDVKDIPPERRDALTVADAMQPLAPELTVAPDASLAEALRKLSEGKRERLLVVRGDDLVGLLTRTGLARFVELRNVLQSGR